MSKSLARVIAALQAAGLDARPVEMPAETRTARQAAEAQDARWTRSSSRSCSRAAAGGFTCS